MRAFFRLRLFAVSEYYEQYSTSFFSYKEFERQFDSGYSNGLAGFIEERAAYLAKRLPEIMQKDAQRILR